MAFAAIVVFSFAMDSKNGVVNVDSISIGALATTLLFALILSFVIAAVFSLIFINYQITAIASSLIFTGTILLYQNITNFISPKIGDLSLRNNILYRLIFITFLGLCVLTVYLINRQIINKEKIKSKNIYNAISVAILILLAYNTIFLAIHLAKTRNHQNVQLSALGSKQNLAANSKNLPNIYYIVLDRHSSNRQLQDGLNYNNASFINTLKKQSFYIDDSALSAYPYTAQSLASTLNANYIHNLNTNDKNALTYNALFNMSRNGAVIRELKKIGYKYEIVGSWYESSNGSNYADKVYWGGAQFNIGLINRKLSEFEDTFLSKNFFAALFRKTNIYISDHGQQAIRQIKVLKDLSRAEQPIGQGKFVFAHILLPHPPYVFNSDGSISNVDHEPNNNGKPVTDKYINQLEFTDDQIKEITKNIVEKSKGNAIIVVLSDEGYYPQEGIGGAGGSTDNKNMAKWTTKDLKAKYGVLAAYHLPNINDQKVLQNVDSVNIFRIILNNYFGYKLSYLPKCNFALKEGNAKPFIYDDITKKLTGEQNTQCTNFN